MRRSFERRGKPVPEMLSGVHIDESVRFFWDAFQVLGSERQSGRGFVGRIPYRAILAMARDHRMDGDDYHEFETIVLAMDEAFVSVLSERIKADEEKAAQAARARSSR